MGKIDVILGETVIEDRRSGKILVSKVHEGQSHSFWSGSFTTKLHWNGMVWELEHNGNSDNAYWITDRRDLDPKINDVVTLVEVHQDEHIILNCVVIQVSEPGQGTRLPRLELRRISA